MVSVQNERGMDLENMVILGSIFLAVGLLMILVVLIILLVSRHTREHATCRANGEVIRMLSRSSSNDLGSRQSKRAYSPEMKYMVGDKEVISHPTVYVYPCNYKVGDILPILYDPDKPTRVIVEGEGKSKIVLLIVGFVGGIVLLIGLFMILLYFNI